MSESLSSSLSYLLRARSRAATGWSASHPYFASASAVKLTLTVSSGSRGTWMRMVGLTSLGTAGLLPARRSMCFECASLLLLLLLLLAVRCVFFPFFPLETACFRSRKRDVPSSRKGAAPNAVSRCPNFQSGARQNTITNALKIGSKYSSIHLQCGQLEIETQLDHPRTSLRSSEFSVHPLAVWVWAGRRMLRLPSHQRHREGRCCQFVKEWTRMLLTVFSHESSLQARPMQL